MAGQGESKTSQRRIEAVEKQKQALELRKAGATYEAIAKKLEYANASGAEHAIKAALKATVQDGADSVRQLELERLDAMLLGLWKSANSGNLGAVDRVLRIQERRAKLLGLDAPTKQDVTSGGMAIKQFISISPDDWDNPDNSNNGNNPGNPGPTTV